MLLLLSRWMAQDAPEKTVRFVAFANEEPPFFQNEGMGSLAYARHCRERGDRVEAMLSLETIGYYSDEPGTQRYPPPLGWFYPDTGNFVGFVGNTASGALVRRALSAFRRAAQFPSEGAALPAALEGVGWSDHWSFWQVGYPAIMVTDTAPFRYPHYHRPADTPEKLDYERMSRVATGLVAVVRSLAGSP
jgi:Zn-dependent M28 family amino/carboxypeptidase